MTVTTAVSLAAFLWFLLGRPSIEGRIYTIRLGAGIIALMVVRALWPLAKPHLIDRLLFWVASLSPSNLIVRPLVLLSLTGVFPHFDGFQHSFYWTPVPFSPVSSSASCRDTLCPYVS